MVTPAPGESTPTSSTFTHAIIWLAPGVSPTSLMVTSLLRPAVQAVAHGTPRTPMCPFTSHHGTLDCMSPVPPSILCLHLSRLPGWWCLVTNSGPHVVVRVTSRPRDNMPADALQARWSPVPWLPSCAKSTPTSHRLAPRSPMRPNVPHAVLTRLGLHLHAQAPSLCPCQCCHILTHTPVPFNVDEHAETHSLPVPMST